jgi:hypothetical protein
VEQEARGPSLVTRLIALVVLAVAAWILLKVVIGVLAGLSTLIVVVLAIVGIVWALGKF